MGMDKRLRTARDRLAATLVKTQSRIVFAESCTAGLACATMAQVDGISSYLCGSMATYREASKIAWLGLPPELIKCHSAESQPVVAAMVRGALRQTGEAEWGGAIVGHLAEGQTHFVWIATAGRHEVACESKRWGLTGETRVLRQHEAAAILCEQLATRIQRGQF